MEDWTSEPPEVDSMGGVRLVRTPATGASRGIILSDDLIGRPTHFDGRHTVPCGNSQCQLCTKGIPWRWHGYIALWLPTNRERIVLELTAQASQRVVEHRKTFGSLRGFDITVSRPKGKINSRVHVVLGVARHPEQLLPECPDVKQIMCYIWGYDPNSAKLVRNIIGRSVITFSPEKPDESKDLPPSRDGEKETPPQ